MGVQFYFTEYGINYVGKITCIMRPGIAFYVHNRLRDEHSKLTIELIVSFEKNAISFKILNKG